MMTVGGASRGAYAPVWVRARSTAGQPARAPRPRRRYVQYREPPRQFWHPSAPGSHQTATRSSPPLVESDPVANIPQNRISSPNTGLLRQQEWQAFSEPSRSQCARTNNRARSQPGSGGSSPALPCPARYQAGQLALDAQVPPSAGSAGPAAMPARVPPRAPTDDPAPFGQVHFRLARRRCQAIPGGKPTAVLGGCGGRSGPDSDGPLSSGNGIHDPIPRGSICVRGGRPQTFGDQQFTNYGRTTV